MLFYLIRFLILLLLLDRGFNSKMTDDFNWEPISSKGFTRNTSMLSIFSNPSWADLSERVSRNYAVLSVK
jgi:hypothetical protein